MIRSSKYAWGMLIIDIDYFSLISTISETICLISLQVLVGNLAESFHCHVNFGGLV